MASGGGRRETIAAGVTTASPRLTPPPDATDPRKRGQGPPPGGELATTSRYTRAIAGQEPDFLSWRVPMRTIEAESQVLRDLREESALVTARSHPDFTVWAVRHPTLGKLVIVEGRDGSGIVVETEE